MSERVFDPFEPEETVGKIWHKYASGLDARGTPEETAVSLEDVSGRLGVFFRGLGGSHAAEIKPATLQVSNHRLSFRRALGTWRDREARPSFDGEALRLSC